MITLPDKYKLAHLPTPIEALKQQYGANLYVKRDDLTGMELSGNKVRKLEYLVHDAKQKGCQVLITCGGIQSNHARATAVAAVKAGMKAHLVLRYDGDSLPRRGNVFIERQFGAKITIISPQQYRDVEQIMADLAADYAKEGLKAYPIRVGASNAIGNFGYINAFNEILEDERRYGVSFDTIVCTIGSGGTYSGLFLGNYLTGAGKRIVGINICDTADYFKTEVGRIANQTLQLLGKPADLVAEQFEIIDGFAGRGYALSTDQEIEFFKQIVKQEGILFDPVYTGKAFRGLVTTLTEVPQKIVDKPNGNVLFVHTGGLFAVFSKEDLFY